MTFDGPVYWHYLFSSPILDGVELTLILAIVSQGLGIVLGVLTAVARLSTFRIPILRFIAGIYVWLFRGTPLLVQLAFVYYAIPQMTNSQIIITALVSAVIAFSLNEGAYMAEIVRAGITSVDAGQTEAARSLGMTSGLTMRRIILPQAIRIIIPPTGNEFISMLKNTSLASSIAVLELFNHGELIYGSGLGYGSQHYFELLAVVSTWYLAMTTVFSYLQSHLERFFERGFSRDARRIGTVERLMVGALRRG